MKLLVHVRVSLMGESSFEANPTVHPPEFYEVVEGSPVPEEQVAKVTKFVQQAAEYLERSNRR